MEYKIYTERKGTVLIMKEKELKKLWFEFGNIPIDINDCIELDFHIWEKGTSKFIVWDWFDDKLPYGIAEWLD